PACGLPLPAHPRGHAATADLSLARGGALVIESPLRDARGPACGDGVELAPRRPAIERAAEPVDEGPDRGQGAERLDHRFPRLGGSGIVSSARSMYSSCSLVAR